MMKTNLKFYATVALALALAAGCASQTPSENTFGDAVRAVTSNQIHDKVAATYPDKEAVTGGNSDRLENVVTTHSGEVPASGQVQAPISFGSGGGQNTQ